MGVTGIEPGEAGSRSKIAHLYDLYAKFAAHLAKHSEQHIYRQHLSAQSPEADSLKKLYSGIAMVVHKSKCEGVNRQKIQFAGAP